MLKRFGIVAGLRGALACGLALVLAVAYVPTAAVAAAGEQAGSGQLTSMASDAEDAIDLNAAWEAQDGGTARVYTISEGGTYYLSADLDVSARLQVDADDADVVIDLGEYTFTSTEATGSYVIRAVSAASLTIEGSLSTLGEAQLVLSGGYLENLIQSAVDVLTVQDVGLYMKARESYTSLSSLSACGVYATAGSVTVRDCTIEIDHSNQGKRNESSGGGLSGCPRGIYLGSKVTDATIADVDVTVLGSPSAEDRSGDTVTATSPSHVYGLYSLSTGDVQVSGSSFYARSPLGTAVCLYAASLTLGGDVALNANAGVTAIGVWSTAQAGITLDGALEVAYEGTYEADYAAALLGAVDDAFVFEEGFSGSGLGVFVGEPDGDANGDGACIGTCASGLSGTQQNLVLASLANGYGDSAVCTLQLSSRKLVFALDTTVAKLVVVGADGGTASYASASAAVAAMEGGDTLQLLADAGDLDFSPSGSADDAFVLDLAGFEVGTLSIGTDGAASVLSSAGRGTVTASTGSGSAISYSGSGSLSIEGVDVYGITGIIEMNALSISGSGDVTLSDVTIEAASQYSAVRGIYHKGAGSVTMSDGSVSAYSSAASVAATGVAATSAKSTLTFTDVDVSVQTSDGTAGGFDTKGACTLQGVGVSVQTACEVTQAWGARGTGDSASVSVDGCDVSVTSQSEVTSGEYWCLMAGSASASSTVQWALSGACSFESARGMLVGVSALAVLLDPSFENEGGADAVLATGLSDDVCFTAADGSSSVAALAGAFTAAEGTAYEGWELAAGADGTALSWEHEAVARNVTQGTDYTRLSAALAAAQEGDELQLLAEALSFEALQIDICLTLDLNGQLASVQVTDSSLPSESLAAVTCAGAGKLAVCDSSEAGGGCLEVVVEGSASTTSKDSEWAGVSVAEDAQLVLDGCQASIAYTTAQTGTGSVQFAGVAAAGSVALQNGAALSVQAYGSMYVDVIGIEANGGDGAGVSIDAASTLAVASSAESVQTGTVVSSASSSSTRNSTLMRIYPEEGTELYEEIQEKFYLTASLDNEEDAGYTYGTNLYYAAPLTLDDGTYVWAFSEPVAAADIGDASLIVASVFFVQSYYDLVSAATGIAADEDSGSAVSVAGEVSVASATGDAFGLDLSGTGTASVEGSAQLAITAGEESYRAANGTIDLRDYLGEDIADEAVFYPKSQSNNMSNKYTGTLIEWANPQASTCTGDAADAVQVDAQASVSEQDPGAYEDVPVDLEDVNPETVEVTFSNMRDADGDPVADEVWQLAYGATLGEGGSVPQPQDFTSATGVEYRFIGWSTSMLNISTQNWNPDLIAEGLVLDDTVNSISTGEVELEAVYVPVREGQHLVTFLVDCYVNACAVEDGTRPSFLYSRAGSTLSTPTKLVTEDGYTYCFTSWASQDGSSTWTGRLPKATEDATYEAQFKAVTSSATLTLYLWKTVDGSLSYTTSTASAEYYTQPAEEVSAVLADGTSFIDSATVYSFLGWSVRKTDQQAIYSASTLPEVSGSATYYAIYTTREQVVDVSFYVDGELYATALGVSGTATVNKAFSSSDNPEAPADKSDEEPFRGWALEDGSYTVLSGAVKTITEIADGEEPLSLYAVFGYAAEEEEEETEEDGSSDEDMFESTIDAAIASVMAAAAGSGIATSAASSTGLSLSGSSLSASGTSLSSSALATSASLKTTAAQAGADADDDDDRDGSAADGEASGSGEEDEDAVDTGEEDADGTAANVIGFFLVLAALVLVALVVAACLLRNRRLDAAADEDDYYETDAGAAEDGETVEF